MLLRRIIANISFLLLVLIILDYTIGRTLRFFYFKETSGLHYRTTFSMDSTRADILIFGASRANHHYVPEVFEDSLKMSFYNTGRDGNGIFYQVAVLKSVLLRYTPRIIIFDYAGSFMKEEKDYNRLSSILPYYKSHGEIREIVELKSPFEKIKLLSEVYPFNSQLLTIAIGNLEINKKRKPDNKGYVPLHKEWKGQIDTLYTDKHYTADSTKVSYFRNFRHFAILSG